MKKSKNKKFISTPWPAFVDALFATLLIIVLITLIFLIYRVLYVEYFESPKNQITKQQDKNEIEYNIRYKAAEEDNTDHNVFDVSLVDNKLIISFSSYKSILSKKMNVEVTKYIKKHNNVNATIFYNPKDTDNSISNIYDNFVEFIDSIQLSKSNISINLKQHDKNGIIAEFNIQDVK